MSKVKQSLSAILSEAAVQEVDNWIAKYPKEQKQSAVMAALMITQREHGQLTEALMDSVADYLDMPKIAVYEVATFYSMYDLKPVGKHKLCVCTNVSCMLRGSDEVVSHLKQRLGISFGETTEDNRFSLKEVECLAACGGAPCMQVGNHYYENLTPARIDEILAGLE